ncbi:sensor histidine kinase [Spirillospora sp. NPDC048911]|uniref:sensor histidine kinase n=1 Tax=Spirillospora sp. NPDC048911 TaxID=3364527 RepID=UPI0037192E06
MARTIIAVVLLGVMANTLIAVLDAGLRDWRLAAFCGCLAGILALQQTHSTRNLLAWTPARRTLTLSAQAALTFAPFTFAGPAAGAIAGFLAGSMLLAMTGPARWALYGTVGGGVLLALWNAPLNAVDIGYAVYFTLLTGLMVYGISSLAALVGQVLAARGELARMAIVQDRLRVARDLHDLLGYNVSAITLKSELSYRLVAIDVDRSRAELREVLQLARRAMADLRDLTDGHRAMSFTTELESARSLLDSTDIAVQVHAAPVALPPALDTTLAIVLREALTNVLRHSKAQRCVIQIAVEGSQACLSVANDHPSPNDRPSPGATRRPPAGPGESFGLGNLSSRLEAIGGTLVTELDGGWFHLVARAPLDSPGLEAPEDDLPVPDAESSHTWHLAAARRIAVLVLAGYALLIVINGLSLTIGNARLAGITACIIAMAGVQIHHVLRPWPARWILGTQLALMAAALALAEEPLGSVGGFLTGTVLMTFGGRLRWELCTLIALGIVLWSATRYDSVTWTAYLAISTVLTGVVVYGISSLSILVGRVDEARADMARMAVAQERLRVARDLHAALGNALSTLAAKASLAHRLLPGSPEEAGKHVAEVVESGRQAIAGVRSVAGGYRHMSFSTELDSAKGTLSAAGIDVRPDTAATGLPKAADALLAVVLREAVTNILRHSDAGSCTVTMTVDQVEARLAVANDGASPSAPDLTHNESGLGNLAGLLEAVAGGLTAEAGDGWFRLLATVPVDISSERFDESG